MTAVAVSTHAPKDSDEDADKFLVEARNAARNALRKQKLLKDLKEKKAQRRLGATLGAIGESNIIGKRRDAPPPALLSTCTHTPSPIPTNRSSSPKAKS